MLDINREGESIEKLDHIHVEWVDLYGTVKQAMSFALLIVWFYRARSKSQTCWMPSALNSMTEHFPQQS